MTISFGAVLYGGALGGFLGPGLGLTLVACSAAALITAALSRIRHGVSHTQDSTMLILAGAVQPLLAGSAATLAPEAQFATVLALVMASTLLTGLALGAAGWARLSFVARFLPYPVLSGLLASIGYLLILSSLSVVADRPASIGTLPDLMRDGAFGPWAPWALGAAVLALLRRWLPETAILPFGIVAGYALFHAVLLATGLGVEEATARGLMLGPFPEGSFVQGLGPGTLAQADWGHVLVNVPVIVALVPVALVGTVLNVQVIGQATDQDADLDREMRVAGIGNVAGGALGGLVAYPSVTASLLGARMRVRRSVAGIVTAALCAATALVGADLLGALPRGLFAGLIFYIGLVLVVDAVRTGTTRLPLPDLVPIGAIVATTIVLGILPALVVGIGVSMLLFMVSYARLPIIRTETTLALRRSIVERAEPDRLVLSDVGRGVRIIELTGSLFFGTAHGLRQHLHDLIGAPGGAALRTLVLDFRAVRDIDASAVASLERTIREYRARGIGIVLTGLRGRPADRLARFGIGTRGEDGPGRPATLEDALQEIEAGLLAEHRAETQEAGQLTFMAELAQAVPDIDLSETFTEIALPDGALIVAQGAPSDEIYVLTQGHAVATMAAPGDVSADGQGADGVGGRALVVARFEAGALIGEMAFYQGAVRSATVRAEGPVRLMRIDAARMELGGDVPERLVIAFHRIAGRHLAQRLDRATRLLRDAQM